MKGAERFLRACRRQEVDRPPVWFMRQAGRSLPEYRALKERYGFLELAQTPELAAEVTLQPVRRFGMDGAILFSDILVIAPELGIEIDFTPGPVIANPILTRADVDNIPHSDGAGCAPYVGETLRILRGELGEDAALIGFAGGPFTTAAYFVEPNSRRSPERLRSWLRSDPESAQLLLEKVTNVTIGYLRSQVAAGAQVIQIFDSWAGQLSPGDYREYAHPYSSRIIDYVEKLNIPVIHFVKGNAGVLDTLNQGAARGVGISWDISLKQASEQIGPDKCLQGNLDPAALFGTPESLIRRTKSVLQSMTELPHPFIFNLGHGILPDTPIENVQVLLDTVRNYG